jgi:dihydroorotate dehydrogenase
MGLYGVLSPVLRLCEPELAHRLTVRGLMVGGARLFPREADPPELRVRALGLEFPNPVGMAAGFDKDGEAAPGLLDLGFGHVEVGTVTPRPQSGNPRPRLFRLTEDAALINRMGFNNKGAVALAARLSASKPQGVVGISIGANKDSSDRAGDYASAFATVAPYAAYIAINVSSPNTPGLRGLQAREELTGLIGMLKELSAKQPRRLPLLVKIAPDLDARAVEEIAEVALETQLDGLIVSNTTIGSRDGLKSRHRNETGGLSGAPLFAPSTALLRQMYRLTDGKLTLIGVGGIGSAEEAFEKVLAGASLVQLYTALVYKGPDLIRDIRRGLARLLKTNGFNSVGGAVGAGSGSGAVQGLARSA